MAAIGSSKFIFISSYAHAPAEVKNEYQMAEPAIVSWEFRLFYIFDKIFEI